MSCIYPGEIEKVTKVKLLDRGELPSPRPCLLFSRVSEKRTVHDAGCKLERKRYRFPIVE